MGVSRAEGVAMTTPSKISTLQQRKNFFAFYLKEGSSLAKIDLVRTNSNRTSTKIKDFDYLLRGIVVLFLFLFPAQSFAKKIKLSSSIILEQKNSLNTNYSYKNQNTYFNQINSNKVKNDSGNFYATINSSLEVTKKYSKTKKIGFFGNIVAHYTNKSDQNDQYHSYLEKSYLFFQEKFGKFEFGKNIATNKKMAISTHNFARGSGGVSGGYLQYLNLPILRNGNDGNVNQIGSCDGYSSLNSTISESGNCSKIKLPKFILLPATPISHGGYATGFYHNISDNNYDNQNSNKLFGFGGNKSNNRINGDNSLGNLQNSLKLNYYTNRIDGFQVGFGYVINAKNDSELDSSNDRTVNLRNI
ncbi:MAG: putative membrane protein, partial [Ulvibacter sp.]